MWRSVYVGPLDSPKLDSVFLKALFHKRKARALRFPRVLLAFSSRPNDSSRWESNVLLG